MYKRLFTSGCLLLLLSGLVACGKKTKTSHSSGEPYSEPTKDERSFVATKELHRAVRENDERALRKVIFENPQLNLNEDIPDGDTLLTIAIKKNHIRIRNILIEAGVSIDKASYHSDTPNMTPMHIAAHLGYENSVKVLIEKKANLNKKDYYGDTPLHKAIKRRHQEVALHLIKNGANIELTDADRKNSYRLAQDYDTSEVLNYLHNMLQVGFGAPTMETFRNVIMVGDIETLRKILNQYPRLAEEYDDANPLALVLETKNESVGFSMAQILIGHGVKVNGPEKSLTTPLIASVKLQKKIFTELYLDKKADVNAFDKDGNSALYHAIDIANPVFVELLINNGAKTRYETWTDDYRKVKFKACKTANDKENFLYSQSSDLKNITNIKDLLGCGMFR